MRTIFWVSLLLSLVAACGDTVTKRGGLMVIVAEDGTLDVDEVRLRVFDRADKQIAAQEWAIGEKYQLPATIGLTSNGESGYTVKLRVSAWKNEVPLDVRDLIVKNIPVSDTKKVEIILSAVCSNSVTLKDGEAVTTCTGGETCVPGVSEGTCEVLSEDAKNLDDYEKGDESSVLPLCEEGTTRCTSEGVLESCADDGTWGTSITCPFVCDAGACTGTCKPGESSCAEDGVTRMVCNDAGELEAKESCPAVCSRGKCEASCDVGTFQCAGTSRLECGPLGTWEPSKTCPFVCDTTTNDCAGECSPNDRGCDAAGEILQLCDDVGAWQTLTDCSGVCIAKESASGGFACADCVPGNQYCEANVLMNCTTEGVWAEDADCSDTGDTCFETSASEANCGGDCSPGDKICQTKDVYSCNAGAYTLFDDCSDTTEICRSGVCELNTEYPIGYSALTGWSAPSSGYAIAANTLYAVPVQPTKTVTLEKLYLRGVREGGTIYAAMAVYSDSASKPNTRLTYADGAQVNASGGENTFIPKTLITLNAGTTYWIVVLFNTATKLDWQAGTGSQADATYPTPPATYPFGSASALAYAWPLYLGVKDVP